MKYLLALFMCLSVACGPSGLVTEPPLAPQQKIKKERKPKQKSKEVSVMKYRRNIIMLKVVGVGSASGFAYSKNLIITAGHFCNGLTTPAEQTGIQLHYVDENNKIKILYNAKARRYNMKMDVCLIRKNNHGIPLLPLVEKYRSVKMGDAVVVGGAPVGYFPYLEKGYVMNPRRRSIIEKFDKMLIIKAMVSYGISGGPIINENGEVIGIARAKPVSFDGVFLAVRASTIKRFIGKR